MMIIKWKWNNIIIPAYFYPGWLIWRKRVDRPMTYEQRRLNHRCRGVWWLLVWRHILISAIVMCLLLLSRMLWRRVEEEEIVQKGTAWKKEKRRMEKGLCGSWSESPLTYYEWRFSCYCSIYEGEREKEEEIMMMVKAFNNGCLFPFWITMNIQLCLTRGPFSSLLIGYP